MWYLILSFLFSSNCDSLETQIYNSEREFKNVQFCRCISGDALDDYKSQVKKNLKHIKECEPLESRADSLWREIKKYK